jgi:ribosomal-protein-alanine N-acetyltransferase
MVGDGELITQRLLLRSITEQDVVAVVENRRAPDWAADFPAEGDREIAEYLSRTGACTGEAQVFGQRHVRERESGLVVGGIGFFGPPRDGRVEIGYGLVASRRGRGLATEAANAMIEYAFTHPGVTEVFASSDFDNPASIRVLEKCGLTYQSRDESKVAYLAMRPAR